MHELEAGISLLEKHNLVDAANVLRNRLASYRQLMDELGRLEFTRIL
ncbi:hypothetical protein [Paenibacillus donghaensis]|nr:hypothetical protein [Paenibacillus donghaensis]